MDYTQLQWLLGGPTQDEKRQMAADALMTFGLTTLANNNNRRNGMQAIGLGGLAGMQALQQGKQGLMSDKLQQFKISQLLEDIKAKQAQEAARQEALASADPRMRQAVQMGVPIADVWKQMNPERKPQLVEVADPNEPLRMVKQWMVPGEQQGTPVGYGQMPESLDPRIQQAKIDVARAGKPVTSVSVNTPYESQFNKEIAGLDAKALDGYRTKAEAGKSMLSTLTRLEQLSPSTYSGGGAGGKLAVANFLQGMGVNIDPEKVANSQEFDAIASRSVLDSLGGSLGAGTSNADVAFIQKTVPQLSHSVEARKQMIEFMRNKAMKQIKAYDSARSHAEQNGGLKGWKAEKEIVRTGTYNGKKVVEYDDGSIEYAD